MNSGLPQARRRRCRESCGRLARRIIEKKSWKIYWFCSVVLNAPFCPIKQKLRRNECEVSMVKIPQHKVTKFNKFFRASFCSCLGQSDYRFFSSGVSFASSTKWIFGYKIFGWFDKKSVKNIYSNIWICILGENNKWNTLVLRWKKSRCGVFDFNAGINFCILDILFLKR